MDRIFFMTNQEGYPNVLEQIHAIDRDYDACQVIIEPKSLNTAPAMACAVKYLLSERHIDSGEPVLFLPSDHYIGNVEGYLAVLRTAFASVGDAIATIGIRAVAPETGYGYIRKGESHAEGYFHVAQFCEKPVREIAESYVQSGEYVWNSGMYLMRLGTFLRETAAHAQPIAEHLAGTWTAFVEGFGALPNISFDYAVSEKSDRVIVFEGDFGWSDIGSFDSLAEIAEGAPTESRHVGIDSKNVFVHSANDRLIATIGLEDIAIVETADSILVYRRGRAEDVKKIVERLKESGAREIEYDFEEGKK
jgi:mannose-1-phosphate guanylyltransferase/mannose-6-phosphate isomerase